MRHIFGTLTLFLTLFSCDTNIKSEQLNTTIEISKLTDITPTPATYRTDKYDFFNALVIKEHRNDSLQFCECSRTLDKITVTIHNGGGGMTYDELLIEIFNDTFISTFKHIGDSKVFDYNAYPVEQHLQLNQKNAQPGECLTGIIEFSGLAIDAFSRTPMNNVNLSGKFTCNVKEIKY